MDFSHTKFEEQNKIGILTINRPHALNALNQELLNELETFLVYIKKQPNIRVLIVTGAGKAFVAGADIKEMSTMDSEAAHDFSELGKRVFRGFSQLKIPVIAAINGFALGGGLELTLGCDIRIAGEDARLGLPEASLGLIPGFNGTQLLPRLIGQGNAFYIMMLGEGIPAREAYQLGLVQKVCPPGQVLDEAIELARKIIAKSPNALHLIKVVGYKGLEMNLAEAEKIESKEFSHLFKTDNSERQEGVAAFLQKRKPNW